MLLEDERNVLRWVTQYGPMPKALIGKMLYGKSDRAKEKIMKSLVQNNYLQETKGGTYLAVNQQSRPDEKMVAALWVLSCFAGQVAPFAHYPASTPAQLFFLKRGVGYEIIVLHEYEEPLLRLIQPQKNTRYIVVLPDISIADNLQLPDAPFRFATMQPGQSEVPDIQFYEMREIE